MPISAANRSIAHSITWIASGRPAPRKAAICVVLVTTVVPSASSRGMSYTPLDISEVKPARIAPSVG
jgi:hypothetical protein